MTPVSASGLAVPALLLTLERDGRFGIGGAPGILVWAGAFAELFAAGRLDLVDGRVLVRSREPLVGAAGRLLTRVSAEPTPRSLTWWTRVAPAVQRAVVEQAVASGAVAVTGSRWSRRRRPLDLVGRQSVVNRWRDLLAGRPVSEPDRDLALLAAEAGYGFRVARGKQGRSVRAATRVATEGRSTGIESLAQAVRRATLAQRLVLVSLALNPLLLQPLVQLLVRRDF